jgi:transposase-like protein
MSARTPWAGEVVRGHGASWRRCRTHYLRELLTKVPKASQPWVATLVRTIFDQPDAAEVAAQFDRVVTALEAKLPAAAEHLATAREDLPAFTALPREIWRQSGHPIPHSDSIASCVDAPTSSVSSPGPRHS